MEYARVTTSYVWMTNGTVTVKVIEQAFYDVWQGRGWTLTATPGTGTPPSTRVEIVGAPAAGQTPVWDGTKWVPGMPDTGAFAAVGSFTYDSQGNVLTDPDGNTYTWNTDGTLHTQTKSGTTRSYTWNSDGTLASVA